MTGNDPTFLFAPVVMWIYDPDDLRFLAVNKEACRVYGYTGEEFLSMTLEDIRPPEDRPELRATIAREGFSEEESNWRHLTAHGHLVHVDARGVPIDFEGRPARLVVVVDQTDVVVAKERLRLAVQASSDAIWDWDIAHDTFWWRGGIHAKLGSAPQTAEQGRQWWRSHVHPDDYQRVVDHMQRCLQDATCMVWEDRYRFALDTGEHLDVDNRGILLRAPDGRAYRVVGGLRDITATLAAESALATQRITDALTGLRNRVGGAERLQVELQARTVSSILVAAIDDFGLINESFGQRVGDDVLCNAAARLSALVEQGGWVARHGAGQFLVVIPEATEPDAIVANLTSQQVVIAAGMTLMQTWCVGIARPDGVDADALIRRAGMALYRAKAKGHGQQFTYSPDMASEGERRLIQVARLREALDRDEFIVHYQPIFSGSDLRIAGLEALVRWQHPDGSVRPPKEFIALCERSGLIVPLGQRVLDIVCRDYTRLRDHGIEGLTLSVNASSDQFLATGFAAVVRSTAERRNVPPGVLELELTESVLLHDALAAAGLIRELAAAGIAVAIDDFGTGYSSLAYLMAFPAHRLKIDRQFVTGAGHAGGRSEAVCEAIFSLARNFGMQVVAEGVETPQQLAWLQDRHCDYVQGFLLGRPEPLERVIERFSGEA